MTAPNINVKNKTHRKYLRQTFFAILHYKRRSNHAYSLSILYITTSIYQYHHFPNFNKSSMKVSKQQQQQQQQKTGIEDLSIFPNKAIW